MQKNNANSNNKKNVNSSDLTAKYKEEMMQQYRKSKLPQNVTIPLPVIPPVPAQNNRSIPPYQNVPKPPQNMPKPPKVNITPPPPPPSNNIPTPSQSVPNSPQNNIPTPSQAIESPQQTPVQTLGAEEIKTPEVQPNVKPEVIVVPELILPNSKCEDRPARTLEELNNPPMPKIAVSVREEVEKTNVEHFHVHQQRPSTTPLIPESRPIEIDVNVVNIAPVAVESVNKNDGLKFQTAEEILIAEAKGELKPIEMPKVDIDCKKSGTKIMAESEHLQGNYETTTQIVTPTQTITQQEVKCGFTSDKSLLPKDRKCNVGYLTVEVMTAADNVPVENATVVVMKTLVDNYKNDVIAMLFTDAYGETAALELPANDPTKSIYSISVFADGYVPVRRIDVPIYADVKSIQPISLVAIDDSKG